MADLVGTQIDRYRITERIDEGGMAIVYKAVATRLESEVAIKVIRIERLAPEIVHKTLKRFEREAKSLAKLTHSNIVGVIDYGEHEGKPYLVMKYLRGGSLKKFLGKEMPWQDAARLLLPIAHALEYAHKHNIIHRDVKPSNILLTESGDPMLADFGIAKIIEEDATLDLTGTRAIIGTPEYMSPEQGLGKKTDPRSDVYSLGVVFYELITGQKPFLGDTPTETIFKHVNEPLPKPTKFVPNLPASVEDVLVKALSKKADERYSSAGDFARALEELLRGSTSPRPIPSGASNERNKPRYPAGTLDTIDQDRTATEDALSFTRGSRTQDKVVKSSQKSFWLQGLVGILVLAGIVCVGVFLAYVYANGNGDQNQSIATAIGISNPTSPLIPTPPPTEQANLPTEQKITTSQPTQSSQNFIPTTTTIDLNYCNKSNEDICVYSVGLLKQELMITLQVDQSGISNMHITINNTKYPCKQISGSVSKYYCTGPKVKSNTSITMQVRQQNDQLIAQGNILIPPLEPPPPTQKSPENNNYP